MKALSARRQRIKEANAYAALLADVQSELIGVSLEFVGDAASDIYVCASMENGALLDQLTRLCRGCQELNVAIPTQLKLHYSVATRSLNSDFEYEPQYSHDPALFKVDLSESWLSEIRARLGAAE